MMHWWPGNWWFMNLHPIWMIVLWIVGAAIVVMVIWVILHAVGSFAGEKTHRWEKRAEEILDERFARGELTEEEYRRMKKLLRNR